MELEKMKEHLFEVMSMLADINMKIQNSGEVPEYEWSEHTMIIDDLHEKYAKFFEAREKENE